MFGKLCGDFYCLRDDVLNFPKDGKLDERNYLIFYLDDILTYHHFANPSIAKRYKDKWNFENSKIDINLACNIAPVGWHSRDLEEVKESVDVIASNFNFNKSSVYEATIIASAIYLARIGKDKDYIYKYISTNYSLECNDNSSDLSYIVKSLEIFMKTDSFMECLKESIKDKKISHIVAPIACSIAEAYYKDIPIDIKIELFKHLPEAFNPCDFSETLYNFYFYQTYDLTQIEEINKDSKFMCLIKKDEKLSCYYWYHSKSYTVLLELLLFELVSDEFNIEDYDLYQSYLNKIDYYNLIKILKESYPDYKNLQDILIKYEKTVENINKNISSEKLLIEFSNELNEFFKKEKFNQKYKVFTNKKDARKFLDKYCKSKQMDLEDFTTMYEIRNKDLMN